MPTAAKALWIALVISGGIFNCNCEALTSTGLKAMQKTACIALYAHWDSTTWANH